jgi:O-antigen/teichoic acid export membrane protein
MVINKLKLGALLSYLVLIVNSLVGLLYIPFMLRMMGKSEFGLYSLVASVIGYLTLLDLGFGNAIIRYTAKFRAENKKEEQFSMFGMFVILYSIIGVVVLLLGLVLYYNTESLFENTMTLKELEKAKVLILLMVFNLAVTFPLSIFGSIISGYEEFVFQKVVQIVRVLLNTILMVIILKLGYKAIGMIVVVTVLNISTLLLNYLYCIYRLRIKIYFTKFDFRFLKEIGLYSFYIFLNVIMDKVYWGTGQFVLGTIVGTTAVAIFAVAIQLQQIYMSFSTAISGVLLPKVTAMIINQDSKKAISDLFIRTGRIQYTVMGFILTSFVLFGKQFIALWAGDGYEDVYVISLLFFIPLLVPLIQNLGIIILQARNQMKFRSLLYIALATLSLVMQIPLSKEYGGIGCAIAISIALISGQVIGMNIYYYYKQNIDIPKFWKEIGKMSIIPVLLGIGTYFLLIDIELQSVLKLSSAILAFTLVYYICFWYGSMNQYERDLLKKPLMAFFKQ